MKDQNIQHIRRTSEKIIAVLPYVYLSNVFTGKIFSVPLKIQGLKAFERTTSSAFKNKNINIRKIADHVHLVAILKGIIGKAKQFDCFTAINLYQGFVRIMEGLYQLLQKARQGMVLYMLDKGNLTAGDLLINSLTISWNNQRVKEVKNSFYIILKTY